MTRELLEGCPDLNKGDLDALTYSELCDLDAVDTNWCESDDDVNSAYYAYYEQVILRNRA